MKNSTFNFNCTSPVLILRWILARIQGCLIKLNIFTVFSTVKSTVLEFLEWRNEQLSPSFLLEIRFHHTHFLTVQYTVLSQQSSILIELSRRNAWKHCKCKLSVQYTIYVISRKKCLFPRILKVKWVVKSFTN